MLDPLRTDHQMQALMQELAKLSQAIEAERTKLMSMLNSGLTSFVVINQSQKLDNLITRYNKFKLSIAHTK